SGEEYSSRDRESQQPVLHRHQGLRAGAHGPNDLRMMGVEPPGKRPECGKDQLGRGGDEAAARDLAAAMRDPELRMEMAAQLRAGLGRLRLVPKHQSVDLRLLDERAATIVDETRAVIADDPGPASRRGERDQRA